MAFDVEEIKQEDSRENKEESKLRFGFPFSLPL